MFRTALVGMLLLVAMLAGCMAGPPPAPTAAEAPPPPPDSTFQVRWTPEEPRVGQTVNFQVQADDPDDPVVDASWDFGDGTGLQSLAPEKSYRQAGQFLVRVEVATLSGLQTRLVTEFTVYNADGTPPGSGTFSSRPDTPRETPLSSLPSPKLFAEVEENRLTAWFEWDREPSRVQWGFGDGRTSSDLAPEHTYVSTGEYQVQLTVWDGTRQASNQTVVEVLSVPFIPHVIIGIPDTGINPYHEMFYRPELTGHPCTYIQGFPCHIPALELSVGPGHGSWQDRFNKDRALWQSIQPGQWYWIPQTVYVGVYCEPNYTRAEYRGDYCILDDAHMHGTGTVSSALMENPDALFLFKDGGSGVQPFIDSGIPVDILSVSWGTIVPIPVLGSSIPSSPIYVAGAGNDPRSTLVDGWKGDPRVISVGGAYAQGNSEHATSAKHAEVVSYFCRPVAQTMSVDEMRPSYCGTSFSGPTVAGALSKVVLELRRDSGYTGSIAGNHVDPLQGITKKDIRDAMNRTASYDPQSQYPNTNLLSVPLNPEAPWTQWGWGFYDGLVAEETLRLLRGEQVPDKPAQAYTYMETIYLAKQLTHPLS